MKAQCTNRFHGESAVLSCLEARLSLFSNFPPFPFATSPSKEYVRKLGLTQESTGFPSYSAGADRSPQASQVTVLEQTGTNIRVFSPPVYNLQSASYTDGFPALIWMTRFIPFRDQLGY